MATPNQIRANRANALRSTGPKTPEGKKICAQNSTRHGMLSQTVVLEGESQSRFEDLVLSLTAQLKPRSDAEAAIVETMAIARWKQMRILGNSEGGIRSGNGPPKFALQRPRRTSLHRLQKPGRQLPRSRPPVSL